ncbi:MAG: hypothetical protein ABFQ95_02115 [Pseudomonadota bacterium]
MQQLLEKGETTYVLLVSSPNSRVNGSVEEKLSPKINGLESENSDLPGDMEKILLL